MECFHLNFVLLAMEAHSLLIGWILLLIIIPLISFIILKIRELLNDMISRLLGLVSNGREIVAFCGFTMIICFVWGHDILASLLWIFIVRHGWTIFLRLVFCVSGNLVWGKLVQEDRWDLWFLVCDWNVVEELCCCWEILFWMHLSSCQPLCWQLSAFWRSTIFLSSALL